MSKVIAPNGSVNVAVTSGQKIALYSDAPYVLTELVGYPNFPSNVVTLSTSTGGFLTTSAFSVAKTVTITSNGPFRVLYEVGTDAVVREALQGQWQTDPVALNATGALTAAMILGGIVTSTTGAAVAGTLPTGTVMDAASSFEINEVADFAVINTGANGFTVTAATGHTVVGNMVVAAGKAGRFRTRKTAANTFVTYSLSNS